MAGNYSIRVPWQDGGWSGKVCADPANNRACRVLKGIAEKRNPDKGVKCEDCANMGKNEWSNEFTPPCLKENGFFLSEEEFSFRESHPYAYHDAFKHVMPTEITRPSNSFNGTPYKWMIKPKRNDPGHLPFYFTGYDPEIEPLKDKIWVSHGKNQREIFEYFWSDAKPEDSLILAYAKATPLTDNPGRVVVAITPARNVGELMEYPYDKTRETGESVPAFSWERFIGHCLNETEPRGFVFPFDQIERYLKSHPEVDPDELLLIVPDAYTLEFSYAAERVSSEGAIVTLGKAKALLRKYEELKFAPPAGTSWKKLLRWLDARIKKAWEEREIYPGLGAVLEAYGLRYGADIARALLEKTRETENPWQSVIEKLDDFDEFKTLLPKYLKPLLKLKDENNKRFVTEEKLANIADTLKKGSKFWELISRLNLTVDQARLIKTAYEGAKLPRDCSPSLTRFGKLRGENLIKEVIANPYSLCEETRLLPDWYKIDLDQIDLAMFPPEYIAEKIFANAGFEPIEYPDDKRRLRALATSILENEAARGHTLCLLSDVIEKANAYRAGDSPVDIAIEAGKQSFARHREFFTTLFDQTEIALVDEKDDEENAIALRLRRYAETGQVIREFVESRQARGRISPKGTDWARAFREALKVYPASSNKDKEAKSVAEKAIALEKLYESSLSVLTGGAGTGKTLTLAILCEDINIQNNGVLILAPTGKARMVLSSQLTRLGIEHEALTVFQFLYRNRHASFGNYAAFLTGDKLANPPATVIIDESSMLTEDDLAALCELLWDAKRVIFSGDPNQLPPIGAGKPFFELCQKLREEDGQPRYAELKISNRWNRGADSGDVDTSFAGFFTADGGAGDRESICQTVAEGGSIEFVRCEGPEDLKKILAEVVEKVVGEINGDKNTDFPLLNFDKSIGAETNGKFVNFNNGSAVENWQIITPYRNKPYCGSLAINMDIHEAFASAAERGGGLIKAIAGDRYRLGKEGIVLGEKVINLRNKDNWKDGEVWKIDKEIKEFYTANGEIGVVSRPDKDGKRTVAYNILFSSQPGVMYKYRPGMSDDDEPLELAWAMTTHKAQGSGFGHSILVLLDDCESPFISRELLYTALTRQKNKLYIITNKQPWEILRLAGPENSETARRMSSIFGRPVFRKIKNARGWHDDRLIHRASNGKMLRSKSELLVYEKMLEKGFKPDYEKELIWEESRVLPDFTLKIGGREIYWEHLGMLGNASYRRHWENKKKRYAEHGISEEAGNLIISMDDEYTGAFDVSAIEKLIEGLAGKCSAVGTYGVNGETDRGIALAQFQDYTESAPTFRDIVPTLVYVESCGQDSEPVYRFGYEAKKKLIDSNYTPNASFFFEIKRWINSLDEYEEIRDEEENIANVKRGDIIRAYLNYVIAAAEQQFKTRFKKIHFTAPVKQKDFFLNSLRDMFAKENREVIAPDESLDEGTAIVYHAALAYLRNKNASTNELNMLIMDCGGGTTDLARCRCSYNSGGEIKTLRIDTSFENGDSNFGGNNITYRMLQILKIKIAARIKGGEPVLMEDLVSLDENNILALIDKYEAASLRDEADKGDGTAKVDIRKALEEIYSQFDRAYQEAEQYVPTRYADYKMADTKRKVIRNFYYLWQMAEAIKIEFYKNNRAVMENEQARIQMKNDNQFYLWVRRSPGSPLEMEKDPLAGLQITFKEIERVLTPDIYALLTSLLRLDNVDKYSYQLSGQSCKISLFNNLLKEFVPGKRLRSNSGDRANSIGVSTTKTDSSELKKYCLHGSIEYIRDLYSGDHKPYIVPGYPNHIYNIYYNENNSGRATNETSEKKALWAQGAEHINLNILHKPNNTRELLITIKDISGNLIHEFSYKVPVENLPYYELAEIENIIFENSNLDKNQIEEFISRPLVDSQTDLAEDIGEFRFFALPAKHAYGVNLFQVYVKKTGGEVTYQLPAFLVKFIPYENEILHTYFDGKH
ncbi:MAG: AAA family ATPase [Desulfovibrio sp.]|nr:AAA family ATPase [Desulfovibrio sp.]